MAKEPTRLRYYWVLLRSTKTLTRHRQNGQGGDERSGADGTRENLKTPCVSPETVYQGDCALLYIPYVILIWAAPIPAIRWHCSLRP